MALILGIETSTRACSVALFENDKLLSYRELISERFTHSENLHVFIKEITGTAKVEIKRLDAVAISSGPGSYTGLRIGVSAAKGICYALGIPLISIDTLALIAAEAKKRNPGFAGHFCPVMDARRMEVYTAIYDSALNLLKASHPLVIDEKSFAGILDKNETLFCGDGAAKCREIIKHPNARFAEMLFPLASNMGSMAFDKFTKKQVEDVAYFEPAYLKEWGKG